MVVALCSRSARVAYADDGLCLTHGWARDSVRAGPGTASKRGTARRTERGTRGIPTTTAADGGRRRWTQRRRVHRPRCRISLRRWRECPGTSRKTR
jgi:hypothetical protein